VTQAINKIKFHAVKALTRLAIEGLDNGMREVRRGVEDYHKSPLPVLAEHKMAIAERFMTNMNSAFEHLVGTSAYAFREEDYEAQADEDDPDLLEPKLAMEGMIAHTRNCDIEENISFSTRLNILAPELNLDESNNPLDPGQIGEAFVQALAGVPLPGSVLLTMYREFNKAVFHKLDSVLKEANGILVDMGVLPDLDISARSRELQRTKRSARRPTMDREARAFAGSEEEAAPGDRATDLFNTMQMLYRALAKETRGAVGNQGSEVISFIDLLYRAIERENALPGPIKQLIGRTQIPVMKIAVSNPAFLSSDQHPARSLLEDIALAGVTWTSAEDVANDPVYRKAAEVVSQLGGAGALDDALLIRLADDFRKFQRREQGGHEALEQRIEDAVEAQERLKHINDYVNKKIRERLLKADLDLSIRELLDTHIHEFLVRLLLREGPGGAGWHPAMNTIDILIWSVQADKAEGDRDRFERINAKLVSNLDKILTLAGVSKTRKNRIMRQLRQVQDYTFHVAAEKAGRLATQGADAVVEQPPETSAPVEVEQPSTPSAGVQVEERFLRQVDNMPIGTWLEFQAAAGQGLRCTLAARIPSIDKLFFVNAQGVKVLETSRQQLGRELQSGTVRIVSDGPLFNRAMEAVIAELRESLAAAKAANAPAEADA
jgi:hypothetical protein